MPFGGLPPCFTVRLEAGVIAPLRESAWNCHQQVFPGWPQILGGSTAQQTDPMPGPVLSFRKVPVPLALTQRSQKMAREVAPTWGEGQGEDLGCSHVPAALISWDERAWCFLYHGQVQDRERGTEALAALQLRYRTVPRRRIVGAEKSKPFPSVVVTGQEWTPDGSRVIALSRVTWGQCSSSTP